MGVAAWSLLQTKLEGRKGRSMGKEGRSLHEGRSLFREAGPNKGAGTLRKRSQ